MARERGVAVDFSRNADPETQYDVTGKKKESKEQTQEQEQKQSGVHEKTNEYQGQFLMYGEQTKEYANDLLNKIKKDLEEGTVPGGQIKETKDALLGLVEYQNKLIDYALKLPANEKVNNMMQELHKTVVEINEIAPKADTYVHDEINKKWGLKEKEEIPDNTPAFSTPQERPVVDQTVNRWAQQKKEEPKKQGFFKKLFSGLFGKK